MKKYIKFPKNCIGCPYATPTGMCKRLFTWTKFWKNYKTCGFDIRHTKRRHDCPLTEEELNKLQVEVEEVKE